MSFLNSCPGSKQFLEPSPEEFKCKKCGAKTEIWSDERTSACPKCGTTVSRVKEETCLDWCPSAEQCLGMTKYKRMMRDGMIDRKDSSEKKKNK